MSEWKLVDVEGIGSGYACLTLDGVSTTKRMKPWPPTMPKRKRPGTRYQTTMSISGRASRRSYFTRLSFRSAT
jgi:hypothetical protein